MPKTQGPELETQAKDTGFHEKHGAKDTGPAEKHRPRDTGRRSKDTGLETQGPARNTGSTVQARAARASRDRTVGGRGEDDRAASDIVGAIEPMSRGESERRPPEASPSSVPVEVPSRRPTAAERPGAPRRTGGRLGEWWRQVGGLPGLAATAADGARWLYRNRRRIASGVRRLGEVLVAILKTAARIGAVLVRMGEALARLEEQRTAKPVGPGRRRAARAGAGLSRFGRRLDHYGRGLLPVADGIEDIGEHLEAAAPGDSTPLPPALADPTPPPASETAVPEARTVRDNAAPSAPPAAPEAIPAAKPGIPEPAARRPPADERPRPASEPTTAARKKKKTEQAPPTPPAPVADDPAAALPEDLRARLRGLGRRPRRAALEGVIEDICRARGWSTTGELADILDRDFRSLNRTYLKPMAAAGRLVRRHPDHPSHPDQAFTVPK